VALNFGPLEQKLFDWQRKRSIATAAEVVAAAITLNQPLSAVDAAEYLLRVDAAAAPAVKSLASLVLRGSEETPDEEGLGPIILASEEDLRAEVRRLRHAVSDSPRNSFLWTDLARAYTILGREKQAIRAMEIALRLAPGNRFVLRSSARLFIHVGDVDRAHDILRNSISVRRDPWVLAAEIAAAAITERTSRLIKTGRGILGSGAHPAPEITELASSIGTVDLSAGDLRSARRLFALSLQDPTENSVAQAEWVSRRVSVVEVDPRLAEGRRAYEAQAWQRYLSGQWRDAVMFCRQWLMDEPFSSRPAQLGSYLAEVGLEDFDIAEKLGRQGLLANPNDPMLLNNLVVALANQNRIDEAEREFKRIKVQTATELHATVMATEGLLAFRRGEYDRGRYLYFAAMNQLPQRSRRWRLAALHLAKEEAIARTGRALDALSMSESEGEGADLPEFHQLEMTVRRYVSSIPSV
jgi:tetratricopeptide (TPR) repeat protein